MIKIDNLHKKYGKNKILTGVDLEIPEKGIFAILGPNGSGKTTMIKSILGMVVPEKGDIFIDGQKTHSNGLYRKNIDYLPQIANFPGNLGVKELIKMIKDLRDTKADENALIQRFGLTPFLDKKLSNLSGGTKQKVNLVLTFMFDSQIIILDEPTTGLDPVALLNLKELIAEEKAKGKTILVTSHIMSFVEGIADEIVFLLEGKIYFKGSIQQLREKTNEVDLEHAIANILKENNA
ncbi:copper ABC transporter ATP-binding protein [Brumimicrobium salinarum]|uniref:Copper ABC transporter ATP-binding protein n=1 Tax=Brumimicrobium salinarum TaxID=2058658 RepID=A0A2I0R3G7_9FLAO|nr:ABC transporter ATP-binding protein [Brumimicrobium salinarum]PKR81126.1 copper ABC transporter ATP-binding protein [Brumimicrobium salinarum]